MSSEQHTHQGSSTTVREQCSGSCGAVRSCFLLLPFTEIAKMVQQMEAIESAFSNTAFSYLATQLGRLDSSEQRLGFPFTERSANLCS